VAAEYRIEYQIQRASEPGGDFEEIGFGSSGAWDNLDMCTHMISSDLPGGGWETEPGQPDPADVLADIAKARS
jgi:hypothetical protein